MTVFVIPYTSPVNYTYDSNKIEVFGGIAKLKEDLTAFDPQPPVTPTIEFGRWHLNETSGLVAPDSSGNGNDGTLVNMSNANWVTGHLNNALNFQLGQYVSFPANVGNWDRTDPFSIETWFKTSYGSDQIIIAKQAGAPNYPGWNVYITSDGYLRLELIYQFPLGRRILVEDPDGFYNNGAWHHLIWTYNGTFLASGITLQIDGADKTSGLTVYANNLIGSILNASNCLLGGRNGTGLSNCVLDEVRFYNRVLNSSEKVFLWNGGAGREEWRVFNDSPTIYKTAGDSDSENIEWNGFFEITGPNHDAWLGYQLSNDAIDWYYFYSGSWTLVTGAGQYNAADAVNSNISSFTLDGGTIYVKVFLVSNGLQFAEIDENQVTYSTNQSPVVDAGPNISNILDHTHVAPFYAANFYDPDGYVAKAYYKVDGQVDVWTEIEQGGWASLLQAVRQFLYLFDVIGDNTVRLKVVDNEDAESEDFMIATVIKITVTFAVRDFDSSQHINSIEFLAGDGSPVEIVNSPFTHGYEWSSLNKLANFVSSGYVALFQVPIPTTVHTETLYMVQSIFYSGKAAVQWDFEEKLLIVNTWFEVQGRLIKDLELVTISVEVYDTDGTINVLAEQWTETFNDHGIAVLEFESSELGGDLVENELYSIYGLTKYNGIEYEFVYLFILIGVEGGVATVAKQDSMITKLNNSETRQNEILTLHKGKWEIVNNQLIKYAANGVTPLVTFDLQDASGNPTERLIRKRIPV